MTSLLPTDFTPPEPANNFAHKRDPTLVKSRYGADADKVRPSGQKEKRQASCDACRFSVMPYHCRFLNPRLKNAICKSEFSVLFQLFSNFFDGCFQELLIVCMKNRYAEMLIFPLASRSYLRLPLPKGRSRPD